MKVRLIQLGKTTEAYLQEGIGLYEKRLKPFVGFETETIPVLRDSQHLRKEQVKEREGELILARLKPDDVLILLDERGKRFSSEEFARFVEKQFLQPGKSLCFVIGGAYGFSEAVYERARHQVALSELTFSHQLVRLIFMEQLYRAFTILNNHPYHHS